MSEFDLTAEEKAVHFETWRHIHEVRRYIHQIQVELNLRALHHDQSKIFDVQESKIFAANMSKMSQIEYNSKEYKECLEDMAPAISHHHQNNRHHPEHHKNGVDDMNLIDLIELLCDWKASTKLSKNGDIYRSLDIAKERFGFSDQLISILKNTVGVLEQSDKPYFLE